MLLTPLSSTIETKNVSTCLTLNFIASGILINHNFAVGTLFQLLRKLYCLSYAVLIPMEWFKTILAVLYAAYMTLIEVQKFLGLLY